MEFATAIMDMKLNGVRMRESLVAKMAEQGEGLDDINSVFGFQPPFHLTDGKYYSEAVFETPEWLYCCRNNAGDGIIVSSFDNPEKFKPECPEGHTLVPRITADPNKIWRTIRTSA